MLNNILKQLTNGKTGIEIGGPSDVATTVYECAGGVDNVVFSKHTLWSTQMDEYNYYNGKRGRVIVNDAVNIELVMNERYDFCFSSHSLEHIANPLKAVSEWLRIIKPGGHVIIVVPEKSHCFDHRREYSKFSTLRKQYENNVGEDDLSTLPEILRNHDLSKDPDAGSFESFTRRSLDNVKNRCLHHYVYDDDLLKDICTFFSCEFVHAETNHLNRWVILKKPQNL